MIRIVAGTGGRCSLRRTIRPMNRSARPLTRTHAQKKKVFASSGGGSRGPVRK